MKQYVFNLYKFLKAKEGLKTWEKQVKGRVTKFWDVMFITVNCTVPKSMAM